MSGERHFRTRALFRQRSRALRVEEFRQGSRVCCPAASGQTPGCLSLDQSPMTSPIPQPDSLGHWGKYGGRFVPETLMAPLEELTTAYLASRDDQSFQSELQDLSQNYAGRPTPLFRAARLTEHCGGATIYLKREDLLHTGAHKINNTIGQVLLARRMNKKRIVA